MNAEHLTYLRVPAGLPNSVRVRRIAGVGTGRTTGSAFDVTLADGRNGTQPYTFRINDAALWKVRFLRFSDGDASSAYIEHHMLVTVT